MNFEQLKLTLSEFGGLQDLISTSEKWESLRKQNEKAGKRLVVLPNYFLIYKTPISSSTIFPPLVKYLKESGLMEFEGEISYYEVILTYSAPEEAGFPSLLSLYDTYAYSLSRFGHAYKGILIVDISEWIEADATTSEKFSAFLAFMSDIDNDTLVFFTSHCGDDSKNEAAYPSLAASSRLDKIVINAISAQEGMELLETSLNRRNYSLSDEAKEALKEAVQVVSSNDKSSDIALKELVNDIIYEKCTSSNFMDAIIHKEDVKRFASGGEWLRLHKSKKQKGIGFKGI